MTDPVANWQAVSEFISDLQNASRLATYVDTVVDIFELGAWRQYTDATGRSDQWLDCEFDYFLIACGASYGDVQRLLGWVKSKVVDIAGAMESEDPSQRRDLSQASAAWESPTGTPLIQLAARQGWTKPEGGLRVSPTPARARSRLRLGMSQEEAARLLRLECIEPERRTEIENLVADLVGGLREDREVRYVIDLIRSELKQRNARPTIEAAH